MLLSMFRRLLRSLLLLLCFGLKLLISTASNQRPVRAKTKEHLTAQVIVVLAGKGDALDGAVDVQEKEVARQQKRRRVVLLLMMVHR